jgi:hypothetical protein
MSRTVTNYIELKINVYVTKHSNGQMTEESDGFVKE